MTFRRYWIFLLLHLICQVHLTSAEPLTELGEIPNNEANNALLSEDLAQQLARELPKNKFTQWLLSLIFISQTPQTKLATASYFPYEGKTIGRIRLDKQGALHAKASGKQQLVNIVLPTTKDWVIWDQLSFASGGIIIPQQLIASQDRLNKCSYIKKAEITIQEREDSRDTVNVYIATQDRFPISPGLDLDKPSLWITHSNLLGWGHLLKYELLYDQGLGHSVICRVPNITNLGFTGELQYLITPKKGIKSVGVFKDFIKQTDYAGRVEISKTRRQKQRILEGNTSPQLTSFSFHNQRIWLGTSFNIRSSDDLHQGRLFLTGKVAHQHFVERPEVTQSTNRYFHNYVLGTGSLGFSNKRHYEDQLVYGVGSVENIPYGSKVNLIGGYQFGEFIDRPYLRLDIAHGVRMQQLGHLYGAIYIGGFWHEKAVEQGILQLQLAYFTPLLGIGNQWIRQFIRLNYLGGYNMFTGELISTNINKASTYFRDPFLGGTQRLHLGLETVLFTPMRFAGCQVAALGFIDAVRLQDAQGEVQQSSFCKDLGIGLRCTHPRFSFGTVQVKMGYAPITQNIIFTINLGMAGPLDDLDIHEPEVILFQEY